MSAKSELFSRLQYLDNAVNNQALIDDGVVPTEHNGAANLLRKGLGIVAFNILEDYIKNKALETLAHISASGVSFLDLPPKLQEASTIGALKALTFRAKLEKKDQGDWLTLIQDEAIKIHSTTNDSYELSKFSLVSANSNVSAEEVSQLMQAFSIAGGWNKLKEVSNNINGGITDLAQSYKNATERRHNAAHTANYRYEYGWLTAIKREILSISASLDILLTARCRQIDADITKNLTDHNIDDVLNYRYLESHGTIYKETISVGGRSRKNWDSCEEAIATLKPRLISNNEFLIILDSSSRVINWHL